MFPGYAALPVSGARVIIGHQVSIDPCTLTGFLHVRALPAGRLALDDPHIAGRVGVRYNRWPVAPGGAGVRSSREVRRSGGYHRV